MDDPAVRRPAHRVVALNPVAADLSVVIVTHNSMAVLPDCLRSLAAAAKELRVEVFVVDNASTDRTVAFVRQEFPDAIVIANEKNRWFSGANNQAMREAHGRHVLCLNPDTIVGRNALTDMVRFLDEHPRAGAVGVRLVNADGSLQPSCRNFLTTRNLLAQHLVPWRFLPRHLAGRYVEEYSAHDQPRRVDWLIGACITVRRETLEEVGLKDESFPMFHEETDWCIRIWRAEWEVWFLPTSEIVHLGGTSTSIRWGEGVVLEYYKAKQQFIRKHYGRGELIAHRAFISTLFLMRWFRATVTQAWLRLRGDAAGVAEQRRRAGLCKKALALEMVLRVPAPDTGE